MGPSPAEPLEVIMVFGSLMVFAALLALGFWMRDWQDSHPGALRALARTVGIKCISLVKHFRPDSENKCGVKQPVGGGSPIALPGK